MSELLNTSTGEILRNGNHLEFDLSQSLHMYGWHLELDKPWTTNGIEDLLIHAGPKVEIGGPTNTGYRLIDEILPQDKSEALYHSLNITNRQDGIIPYSGRDARGRIVIKDRVVDVIADGMKLPFSEKSIGSIYGSGVAAPDTDRYAILDEVERVLKPGGLFVWQAGNIEELQYMIDLGMTPRAGLRYQTNRVADLIDFNQIDWIDVIMQKPIAL